MSCGNLNIVNQNTTVVTVPENNTITITDLNNCNTITAVQSVTEVIQVNIPGPSGLTGPPGPQGPKGDTPTAGGINTEIQFNSGSEFSGSSNFTFDYTANKVVLTGSMDITGSLTVNTINVGQNTLNFIDNAGVILNSISVDNNTNVVLASGSFEATSFSGSFTGSLQGTSSLAESSSYALSASYLIGGIDFSTLITTSSFNAFTSSYNTGSFTGSFIGDGSGLTNISASAVIGLNLSQIISGSYSASISNDQLLVNTGVSAFSFTGSLFGTASWADNYNESDPIFVAKSASLATTGSNTFKGNQVISGSVDIYIPAGAAYGINENPISDNVFWSYVPQDTNTTSVQPGWTAIVQGGGTYTVTNVQTSPPFIYITLSDPLLTLAYRVGINFSSPSKLWKFSTDGTTDIPGDVNLSGSITFDGDAQIIPNTNVTGAIDITAGPGGGAYASLTSNNTQSFVWVDNDGAYVGTSWDTGQYQFEFRNDGYFILPQVQAVTKQAGIISAGDIIIKADEPRSWRFASGSGILYAPGGIEAPSFTGSLQGTSSWANNYTEYDPIYNAEKGQYLTTGSYNTIQTISGSLVINQNFTVLGSSSVQYVTSSQLNVGTNLITVNTATPSIRFGGLAVYDSGSTGLTGSILWDSEHNVWIYQNPSGGLYDGAMILVGPRSTTLGNEVGIRSGYAAIGNGSHHMTSSVIYNSGSLIRLETNTQVTGSLTVSEGITGSLNGTASWATNAITSSYPIAVKNSTLGNPSIYSVNPRSGIPTNQAYDSIFLGSGSGIGADYAKYSNFLGNNAGYGAQGADNSNFLGRDAGYGAINAYEAIFLGQGSGYGATQAGYGTFIGSRAGYYASNGTFSILIGYNAGTNLDLNYYTPINNGIGPNNIIIGSNISLEEGRQDSINIGGILFGTGSYFSQAPTPFSGSSNGRIGINVVNPQYTLDVSGSGNFTNGLIVTGSIIATSFSGSIVGYVPNTTTSSFVTNSQTSSMSVATASYAINAALLENLSIAYAIALG